MSTPDDLALSYHLHAAAVRVMDEFKGIFSSETIERYLTESREQFENAPVKDFVPLVVERFARERLRALGQAQGSIVKDVPEVLFVCVHNAGRSQMAAALLEHRARGRVHVRSAGSDPADVVNPAVVQAVAELGLDLSKEFPKPLSDEVVRAADVVITMGCGDACPIYPGKRYLDWELDDPAGRSVEQVRPILAEMDRRVQALLDELLPAPPSDPVREAVRAHYAAIARGATRCCPATGGTEAEAFGAGRYQHRALDALPEEAVAAAIGCADPVALAELGAGEVVVDLGSGGGIDVLLAARAVGPRGYVYGIDMTEDMLELARANQAKAGVKNAEFRQGQIEVLPLPDASADVVVSNCVVNLSTDKAAVFAEAYRVLRPGGRLAIADLVSDRELGAAERADLQAWAACLAGALTRNRYVRGLQTAGFTEVRIDDSHEAAEGFTSVLVRAVKSADAATQAKPPSQWHPRGHEPPGEAARGADAGQAGARASDG